MNMPGDGRKVAQLRNDVDDIYDMLGGINATLDQHTATLADHGEKLDRIIGILETR